MSAVKREFLINIVLLFVINLMIKPIYIFGIEAKVQDLAGIQSYGLYFFYFNFIFLFQFINDPGLQNWNAQYIPKNRSEIQRVLPEIFQAKMLLSLIFLLIVNLISYFLGYIDGEMIFYISLSFVLSSFFMILRGMIAGLGFYRTDSLISALDKLLMIIILGYLLYFTPLQSGFDILWFVRIQCIVFAIVSIIAMMILSSKTPFRFKLLSYERWLIILRSGAPYVLIMIFMTAYNKLDGVMLGWLLDDNKYQAGIYAAAYRFYEAANMSGYLFASLLLPMYASNIDQKPILTELMGKGTKLTTIISFIILGIIFFYGERILQFLYSAYYPELYTTLQVIMMAYSLVAVSYIFGTYIAATGKVKNLNILFTAGLIVNIMLCLILIPEYGAQGAAWSTLITQLFVMIGQIYLVNSLMSLSFLKKDVKLILFYGITVIVVFWVIAKISDGSWLLNLGLSILICVLLSFIFKILDKKEILMIFKGNK
ncbi:MAG: oligosaccharide flippase family protein [Saprospiraceae bacterium]|nr:oligosaccharide flippase family protein [Saprospiraceae bacterium]